MLSSQKSEQLKSKLKEFYETKKFLPKILEDEDFPVQEIEETYVNLMLIEVEKEQGKDKGDSSERKEKEEKAYGAYEEVAAKKTEINLENIFDSKHRSDGSTKKVNKVLIYGRAGIGKTTLCNYISYKWAQPDGSEKQQGLWKAKFDYVFWLPLRDLSGDWYTLHQNDIGKYALECFIWRYCLGRDDGFSIQDISKVIKEGKVLWILDGYDEIASFHNKKHTAIKDVIDSGIGITNKQAKVIMTSRPNAVSHGLVNKFDVEIENIGLKKENVYEYINNKYKFKEIDKFKGIGKAEGLTKLVKQHGHIESIAQVPINLYLLRVIWNDGSLKGQAEITTTGLYEEVTFWLMKKYLSKSKAKKLVEIDFDGIEKGCEEEYRLLEKLAYCAVKKKTAILRREEFLSLNIKWDKLSVLNESGILSGKMVCEGVQEYEFTHFTFQEYFAAKYIVKLLGSGDLEKAKEAAKFINENKYNRAYERVILFIAGLVTLEFPKESGKKAMRYFWNAMFNGDMDLYIVNQVALLIKCLEEGKCNREIPKLDKVVNMIKQYSLKHFRQLEQSLSMCAQVLHETHMADVLVDGLDNSNRLSARKYAAYALCKLKLEDAKLAKKITMWLSDKGMCVDIMRVLGELRLTDEEVASLVIKALFDMLKNTDNVLVLIEAASALGKLTSGDENVTNALVEAIVEIIAAPHKWKRSASSMLKLDLQAVAEMLVHALCDALKTGNAHLKNIIMMALCKTLKTGDMQSAKVLTEVLRSTLKKATAYNELKPLYMQLANIIATVLYTALENTDQDVRIYAIKALGELKYANVRLTRTMVKVLTDAIEGKELVRIRAVSALGVFELRDEEVTTLIVEELIDKLDRLDKDVCVNAIKALGRLKLNDAKAIVLIVKKLIDKLEHSDKDVCIAAIEALGRLKLNDAKAIALIVKKLIDKLKLHNTNKEVCIEVIKLFGELKIRDEQSIGEAADGLIAALKATDRVSVRIDIACVLWKLKPGDVQLTNVIIETLFEALKSDYVTVRRDAANALEQFKNIDALLMIDALCEALKDDDEMVRGSIARALGELKLVDAQLAKQVVVALCDALKDFGKGKRHGVASALGKLKLNDAALVKLAIQALQEACADSDKDVRNAAVVALGELRPEGKQLTMAVITVLSDLLGDHSKDVHVAAVYALGKLKLIDIEKKAVVKALSNALKRPDEYVCKAISYVLKGLNENVQEEVVELLLRSDDKDCSNNTINVLSNLEVTSLKAQRHIAEALIKNLLSMPHSDYRYEDGLNIALEKCAVNDIRLSFTSHSIKLLELSDLKILKKSAITLSNGSLTLHYGDHKLVFEFDKSDKELPLKVWKHFRKKAEKELLPTEMLDSLTTWPKWIEIEGIDPEIDKVISNKIINMELYMKNIINSELELNPAINVKEADKCVGDLLQVCEGIKDMNWLKEQYKDQAKSPILVIAMQMAFAPALKERLKANSPHAHDDVIKMQCDKIVSSIRPVIVSLYKERIGREFTDSNGNSLGHYAMKYWFGEVKDILNTQYARKSNSGATILHTAVYYDTVKELLAIIPRDTLSHDAKASFGNLKLTALELAIVLGKVEAIAPLLKYANMKSPSTDLIEFDKNILKLAINFGNSSVLNYLLHNYEFETSVIQDALNFACVVNEKGNLEALKVIINSFKHNGCSLKELSSSGNTALHEVVAWKNMDDKYKEKIIGALLFEDRTLTSFPNKDNQLPSQLAEVNSDIQNFLKYAQNSAKYKLTHSKIGDAPITNLVLKGGGPRGIVFIGALKALEKIQKERDLCGIQCVAGTSAGAITAGLYAVGYTGAELEQDLASISMMSFLDNKDIEKILEIHKTNGIAGKIAQSVKHTAASFGDFMYGIIKNIGMQKGLCSGSKFEEILGELIKKQTNIENFTLGHLREKIDKGEKGYKEFYAVTIDISGEKQQIIILSSKNRDHHTIRLVDAIRASMSIPLVFVPKNLEYYEYKTGKLVKLKCIDGGVLWNYPVNIFDQAQFIDNIYEESDDHVHNPYTLGLSIDDKTSDKKDLENVSEDCKSYFSKLFEVMYNSEEIMNVQQKGSNERRTIKIDSLGVGLLDFDLKSEEIKTLIKEGEKAVQQTFDPEIQFALSVPIRTNVKTEDSTVAWPLTTTETIVIGGLTVIVAATFATYTYKGSKHSSCELF